MPADSGPASGVTGQTADGPSVVSKTVPLEACEEIDLWWHPDEDGPKPRPESRPDARPGVASTVALPATRLPAPTSPAALPAALPPTTIIRPAPFRGRSAPRPRYHPRAVFDSTPIRRGAGRIGLGLLLGLVAL